MMPLTLLAASPAAAGTCQEPGSTLTPQERHNVASACEMIAAAVRSWSHPVEGRQRLEAVQADDFRWFIPSASPDQQRGGNREDYVKLVTEKQFDVFRPGSKLEIVATTAQGNRVATEMIGDIATKNGAPYTNRYHLLFVFDKAGKIREYRLFEDSEIHVRDHDAVVNGLIHAFFDGLSSGGVAYVRDLLADGATWDIRRAGDHDIVLQKEQALAELDKLQRDIGGLAFTVVPNGVTIDGDRVAVEVVSTGTTAALTPYHNNYHYLIVTDGKKIRQIRQYGDTRLAVQLGRGGTSVLY